MVKKYKIEMDRSDVTGWLFFIWLMMPAIVFVVQTATNHWVSVTTSLQLLCVWTAIMALLLATYDQTYLEETLEKFEELHGMKSKSHELFMSDDEKLGKRLRERGEPHGRRK